MAGLFLATLLSAETVQALELHSFIDDECQVASGLLVRVDENQIRFIGLDGRFVEWPVTRVASVVIHRALENPIRQVQVNSELRALARDVWMGRDRTPTFTGWPVGFYDQLIIFFDTEGRSHVVEPQDIRAIHPAAHLPDQIQPPMFAESALDFPPELVRCPLARAESGLRPSRVLGDRIKVSDYLSRLRDHYQALDGFEERTLVYARPFVFDPATRLGLSYFSGARGALVKYLPLYVQWSSGRPYRFQSQSSVGVLTSPWLPILEPTLGFRSDVKSHFFNASFVGHLVSLPAGSNPYSEEQLVAPKGDSPAEDELFNYLMLMGADWGPFSVSGGALYRTARFTFANNVRHAILAEAMSPTVRLMYTGASSRLRLLYFRTRQDRAGGQGWYGLAKANAEPNPSGPFEDACQSPCRPGYALSLDSVRAGIDIDLPRDLQLSADELITVGHIRENFVDAGSTPFGSMDVLHAFTSLSLSAQFSRYVVPRGFLNIYHRRYDTTITPVSAASAGKTSRTDFQLGGALEFLF